MRLFDTQRGGHPLLNAYEIPITDTTPDISPLLHVSQYMQTTQPSPQGVTGAAGYDFEALPRMSADWRMQMGMVDDRYQQTLSRFREDFETNFAGDPEGFLKARGGDITREFQMLDSARTELETQIPHLEGQMAQFNKLLDDDNFMQSPMITEVGGEVMGFGELFDGNIGWGNLDELDTVYKGAQGANFLAQTARLGDALVFPERYDPNKGVEEINELSKTIMNASNRSVFGDSYHQIRHDQLGRPMLDKVNRSRMLEHNFNQFSNLVQNITSQLTPEAKTSLIAQAINEARRTTVTFEDEDGEKHTASFRGIPLYTYEPIIEKTPQGQEIISGIAKREVYDPDTGEQVFIDPHRSPDGALRAKAMEIAIANMGNMYQVNIEERSPISSTEDLSDMATPKVGFLAALTGGNLHNMTTQEVIHTRKLDTRNIAQSLGFIKEMLAKEEELADRDSFHKQAASDIRNYFNENEEDRRIFEDPNSSLADRQAVGVRVQEFMHRQGGAFEHLDDNQKKRVFGMFRRALVDVPLWQHHPVVVNSKVLSWARSKVFPQGGQGEDVYVNLSNISPEEQENFFFRGERLRYVELPNPVAESINQYYGHQFHSAPVSVLGQHFHPNEITAGQGNIVFIPGVKAYEGRRATVQGRETTMAAIEGAMLLTNDMLKRVKVDAFDKKGEHSLRSLWDLRKNSMLGLGQVKVEDLEESVQEAITKNERIYGDRRKDQVWVVPADFFIANPDMVDQITGEDFMLEPGRYVEGVYQHASQREQIKAGQTDQALRNFVVPGTQ